MKIWRIALTTIALILSASTHAALLHRGGGMIYDDMLDLTWITDAGLARSDITGDLTWWAAVQWAQDLTYGGYSDWRLPDMDVNNDGVIVNCGLHSLTELECRDNEYDYLYTQHNISVATPGDFFNIGTLHYWSGTENPVFPDLAYLLNFDTGFRGTTSKITYNRNAWAVRDGDVIVTPLPSAVLLFGSGLLGLTGIAIRKTCSR